MRGGKYWEEEERKRCRMCWGKEEIWEPMWEEYVGGEEGTTWQEMVEEVLGEEGGREMVKEVGGGKGGARGVSFERA